MLHFGIGLLVHLSYDTIVLNTQNRRFHVLQPTFFVSHGDARATMTQNVAPRKDNSMLAKRLVACTYLSSILSELYDV